MERFAVTTAGVVPAADLGIVLPHEHLLFDLSGFMTEPLDEHERAVRATGLTLETSADLRRSPLLTSSRTSSSGTRRSLHRSLCTSATRVDGRSWTARCRR